MTSSLEKRVGNLEEALNLNIPEFETRKPCEDLQSWMCRVIDYYGLTLEHLVPGDVETKERSQTPVRNTN